MKKTWRHKSNGKIYVIVSTVKMKHPVTREWVDAILYREKCFPELFVRLDSEWDERFEAAALEDIW